MLKHIVCMLFVAGCVLNVPRDNDMGAKYLGAQYINDPLGEGTGYDSDPLIRTDAFDCTTFVETVLADGNARKLNNIRYQGGQVDFVTRNHFIETDWLENNADLVRNVSAKYAITDIRRVVIDKSAWMKKVHNIDIVAPVRDVELEYIPYNNVRQINNTKPLVVLFISGKSQICDKIRTDIAVRHMGILLPGGRVMRHASTGRGVVDDDFQEYLKRRQKMGSENIGIMLLEIK